MVSGLSLTILLLYLVLTLAYSLSFKKVELLDVLVLACLYTLRIAAGAAAIDIWPSIWLLAFSMFLFISLALQLMWLVCPLLLYWVGYLWLTAHRGKMHHEDLLRRSKELPVFL